MHYPVILRCTGSSNAWLSPSNGQDTCYFGFVVYYADDGLVVDYAIRVGVEQTSRDGAHLNIPRPAH